MLKAARDDEASQLKFTHLLGVATGLGLFPECFPLGGETLETEPPLPRQGISGTRGA